MNAASRNPNEFDRLYGTCLTAFALIETFIFLLLITHKLYILFFIIKML